MKIVVIQNVEYKTLNIFLEYDSLKCTQYAEDVSYNTILL